MLEKFDNIKVAFFVEEEYGCKGANNCDKEFLKNKYLPNESTLSI